MARDVVQDGLSSVVKLIRGTTTGTGFVIRSSAQKRKVLILTNYHVAQHQFVEVHDRVGWRAHGTVRWFDAASDLALIEADDLPIPMPAMMLRSFPQYTTGETVYTIGHPRNHDFTVSKGIISAQGRSVVFPGRVTMVGMLQTDAYVDKGSSGGPLMDANGLVVGIVQSYVAGARIGYALPSHVAETIIKNNNHLEDW